MDERLLKARKFCIAVRELAKDYELSYFFVTEGASVTDDYGCEAVAHARKCHAEYEVSVGDDPEHDWSDELRS